jgi:hypothetical protein
MSGKSKIKFLVNRIFKFTTKLHAMVAVSGMNFCICGKNIDMAKIGDEKIHLNVLAKLVYTSSNNFNVTRL